MTFPLVPDLQKPAVTSLGTGRPTGRRGDIQGLRALAVVLVVAFHAGLPLSGGFIGVDMFFVISGFVITRMLLTQLDRTSTVGFAAFYTRRLRRLLPALALVIVVVAVASTLLLGPLGPQQATAKTGIAASLFSANIQLGQAGRGGYFDLAVETNALLHTWSLSVEEQFYLVFPAFLLVAWRIGARCTTRRSRRRRTAAIVLLATLASFALSWYTTFHPISRLGRTFAFYSASTRAWEFGVGVLLALAAPALARLTRRLPGTLGAAGLALIAIGAVTLTGATPFPGVAALLPVVGTALVIVAGMTTNRGVTALLGVRPAVWTGDVSYGWYLWHWPLIVFATALWPGHGWVLVVVAVASLGPTWLSYRFLENPIRFNDRLTGRRMIPLVALGIMVPIAACLGLLIVNRIERHTDTVMSYAATARGHGEGKAGCDDLTPLGSHPAGDCTWSVDNPRGTVYLVGDSNAEHFVEPAAVAANQLGYDLTSATLPGCPFVDLVRPQDLKGFGGDGCHRFVTESVSALAARSPALVIIASSSSQYIDERGQLRDPRTGAVADTPDEKAALWERGLAPVLEQLAEAGIPTLVVNPVPHLGAFGSDWQRTICPAVRIYTHSCGEASIDRAKIERQQQAARDAENQAVAGVPGAASVDFTDDLCSPEACTTDRDGLWLYRDGDHLSVDGALTLTDRFREVIAAHVTPAGT